MSKLIVYRMNGGKIIDLVKCRRNMAVSPKKEDEHEEPAMAERARNEWRMPVLTKGKRTPLRWLLREMRGVC